MKVVVAGGRGYRNKHRVFSELDAVHKESPITLLAHGGATGADESALEWAVARGVRHVAYPALWRRYRHGAGPERNARMLREVKPDLVVAFPGNQGTADCVAKALKANHRVVLVVS